MTATILFKDFNDKHLIIGNGEFFQSVDRSCDTFTSYGLIVVQYSQRCYHLFLNGRSFSDSPVCDLESDKINVKWNVGNILYLRVEVQHPIVGINTFDGKLHPILFT